MYVALIMRDYAAENHTTLAGRYDITVHCTDSLAVESYGELTGSLELTSPTTYQAIGTAKPPAPPPWPMVGDDPVLALDPASPPTDPVPAPGQPPPPPAAQVPGQAPGADPQVLSPDGQLASQRNDVTVQDVPWLVVVLVSVVLVALVAAVAARQIRKRRSS